MTGTGGAVVVPKRSEFPMGSDGDALHVVAVNKVVDKELSTTMQVCVQGPCCCDAQADRLGCTRTEWRVSQEAQLRGAL